MKKNHVLRKIALSGIVVIAGIFNSYGQEESACLCQPNNDTDYVVPAGSSTYNGTNPFADTCSAPVACTISGDHIRAGAVLHLTDTENLYTLTGNLNNKGYIYIHEGVTLIMDVNPLSNLQIFNRGTITREGDLGINGGALLVNAGELNISGTLGNVDGAFSNYGMAIAKSFMVNNSGIPICSGNGSILAVETIGNLNASFGGIDGGGTFKVEKSIGSMNNTAAFAVADQLVICVGSEASLPVAIGHSNWGKATVTKNCDTRPSNCASFFPTISPSTFTVDTETTFKAALRGNTLTENDVIYWLVNDNLQKTGSSTDSTFTFTPTKNTDKVKFIIERGTCKKMSNGVTMSTDASVDAPYVSLDWKEGTAINDTIKLCGTSTSITIEALAGNAGLYPQYQWKINDGVFSKASLDKDTTFTPAENDTMVVVQLIPDVALGGLGGACSGGGSGTYPSDWILTDTIWLGVGEAIAAPRFDELPSICSIASTPTVDLKNYVDPVVAPLAGTFSGTGVNASGIFSSSVASEGYFDDITYTLTNTTTGCQNSTTQSIHVADIPNPGLTVSFPDSIFTAHLVASLPAAYALKEVDNKDGSGQVKLVEIVRFQYREKGSGSWTDISSGSEFIADKTLPNGTYEFQVAIDTYYGCSVTSKTKVGVIRCNDCAESE